jgi:hypothetical protein
MVFLPVLLSEIDKASSLGEPDDQTVWQVAALGVRHPVADIYINPIHGDVQALIAAD